jgi:hypothetical protein
MQTKLLLATCALLAVSAGEALAQVSCSGIPAFQSCTAYASGASVVFGGAKYTAVAPISATRDCPPSSPYDPSTDNWWTRNGTCTTGATATATVRPTATPTTQRATATARRARVTATRARPSATRPRGTTPTATTTRPRPTSTATATATVTATPVATPWAPDVFYLSGTWVTYDNQRYRCMQHHQSRVGLEPPNAPSLWQHQMEKPVLTVTNGTLNCKGAPATAIRLSWNPVYGAASYMVEWGRTSDSILTPVAFTLPATATSYDLPDLSMAGYYRIRAAARDWLTATYSDTRSGSFVAYGAGCPGPCPVSVPPARPNPVVPTNVTGSATSHPMNQSQWDTQTSESDYHVYRSNTSGGPYTFLGATDKTTGNYQDYETVMGRRYFYVVRNVFHYTQGTGACQQIYEMTSASSAEVDAVTGDPAT